MYYIYNYIHIDLHIYLYKSVGEARNAETIFPGNQTLGLRNAHEIGMYINGTWTSTWVLNVARSHV